MRRATGRKVATLGVGTLAYIFARRQTRRERIAAHRARILASYDAAAADPEFMRELAETDCAFDVTVGDGLEPEEFA
ncbi:MAG TPA: hypothetical protein VJT67_18150 [Longimicrobiaceae bacterium]|nr:hypothetical protein [Longimicrobiaceae bacterium]